MTDHLLSQPLRDASDASAKVFIKTFGCQMNVYDSQRISEALGVSGFSETSCIEDADLVLLNTCHIREKAGEKVYSDLGRVREVKEARSAAGRATLVAVAGCVAQAEGAQLSSRAPFVDIVVGPQSYHRLPELIERARRNTTGLVDTAFPDEDKFSQLPARAPTRAVTAYLTVQEGCDKFCTFCVVPYTRGAEFSRPVDAIMGEARQLVEYGVREFTLLGQNVNAYHGAGPDGSAWTLAQLIRHLASIDGLVRLRYTTSHPRDMSEDLVVAHAEEPKLMPHLHLPFQSGADRILAAMNRKHTAKDYLNLIDRIRRAVPDIAFSTDVIAGFPGETEAEFEETLSVVRTVGFAQAYSFRYSPRPGTPAAKLSDAVPDTEQRERLAKLQEVLIAHQLAFNEATVGRRLPVLFERQGRHPGQLIGRSPYLQAVHAEATPDYLGRVAEVEISAFGNNSLAGVLNPT
jgi:tRNA-2-methylthio-N6-dimethylallyladenosine synthase